MTSPTRTRLSPAWLLTIAALALVVRLWTLFATEYDYYYAGLSLEAAETARNMLAGRGFGTDGSTGDLWEIQDTQLRLVDIEGHNTPGVPASHHSFRRYNLEGTYLASFNRPWGYPALLAATFALTGHERYFLSRVFTLLLDVGAAVTLAVIATRFLPRSASVFAGVSYALFTPFAFLSTQPIWDAVIGPLLIFGLYFWVEALRAQTARRRLIMAALIGAMAGISYQFRLEMVVYPAVLAIMSVFAVPRREWWRISAVALLVALASMIPWGVRNYRLIGRPLLTGTPGIVWRNGLGELPGNPWGFTMWDTDANLVAIQHGYRNAMTPEASDLFTRQAAAAVRSHPGWALKTMAHRVPYSITSWGWWTYGSHWAKAMHHHPTDLFAETMRRLLQVIGVLLMLGAATGAALAIRARQWRAALPLLAPTVLVIATHIPTHWEARYTIPIFASYILLAGWSVAWLTSGRSAVSAAR